MPRKGQKQSAEARARIGDANRGKVVTDETRKKLSIARAKRVTLAETRDKLSAAHKGRIVSVETREKMSIALTGRRHSEDAKKRMRASRAAFLLNVGKNYRNGFPTVTRPAAETAFEEALKRCGVGGWVTEQRVHTYRCDFAFVEQRIDVEIDGKSHRYRVEHDKKRDTQLASMGWTILRFSNKLALSDPYSCIVEVMQHINGKKQPGE